VEVVSGGGPLLPVERERIARAEAAQGARLACQVTVRGDLAVRLPDVVLGARRLECRVVSTRHVALFIREIVLDLPPGEAFPFEAGAFVQVTRPPGTLRFARFDVGEAFAGDWRRLGLLERTSSCEEATTRAYSLANAPTEGGMLLLDVRLALPPPGADADVPPGVVSSWLFGLRPGDRVPVSGPFGHFFARPGTREMVFVGGGAGMAPMRSHVVAQLEQHRTNRTITFWYGARSRRDLFYVETFDRLQREHPNFRWTVALSEPAPGDAWDGPTGFIHHVLHDRYLADHPAPEECEYYLCGPPVMVRAVTAMLDDLGVEPDSIFYDDFGG
jgi:Na+-transporting NADH:ubiquinone oxidoreductase subunit F